MRLLISLGNVLKHEKGKTLNNFFQKQIIVFLQGESVLVHLF